MDGNPGIKVRSDAVKAGIILAVRSGTPKTIAAGAMGMHKTTFYDWLKDDPDFKAKLDEARDLWVKQLVDRALEIATSQHKDSAAMTMWLLERRVFNYFSRKERVNLGATGDPDDVAIEAGTSEALPIGTGDDLRALLKDAETITTILRAAAAVDGPTADDSGSAPADPTPVRAARTNGKANGVPPSSS